MQSFKSEFIHNYRYSRRAGLSFLFKSICNVFDHLFAFLAPIVIVGVSVLALAGVGLAVYFHFVQGLDIPYVELQHIETAAYWGQIGDFVGGMLNPLLSFAALMAVLYSLRSQSKELALARLESKENQRIQAQQSAIFERQNFESVFFRLLDIHSKLANELVMTYSDYSYNRLQERQAVGGEAFKYIVTNHFPYGRNVLSADDYKKKLLSASKDLELRYQKQLAHYFRNLYQILKQIDSLGMDPLRLTRPSSMANARAWAANYNTQRNYANMLRAQMSSMELHVILLNCLTEKGEGMKYYVERFSLLKHVDRIYLDKHFSACSELIDDIAFADSEEISPARLHKHIRKRVDRLRNVERNNSL
ncbi:putative phage abortive infection protein [Pseudomonas chlororaphis]|uniref:putative phage abortive infection protein n=1 Tax=Pseudomonas chlororaphis TaxID=587753 RepID=UPI0039E12D83